MDVIRFALLGLGVGAMYALTAQGVIIIYRGSGVLNFAQGAIGLFGAYVYYEMSVVHGLPAPLAFAIGVAAAGLLGAVVHVVVMRPLRRASPLVRLVATLGVLLVLQALAVLRYGSDALSLPSWLPTDVVPFSVGGDSVVVSADRLYLVGIAVGLTVILTLVYNRTMFGLATSAVAENQRNAAALGWSANLIAGVNWTIGAALAGAAAILITPIITLQATSVTTLVLSALAVALVAGFRSFPVALVAGLVVGIGQSEISRFAGGTTGLAESLPVIVIIAVIVVRGRALPLRGFALDRLPRVGDGLIRPRVLAPVVVGAVVVILLLPDVWVVAATATLVAAIILLSLVVLAGYTGQLSLAQFTLAGLGAYVCGRLNGTLGMPLPVAFVIGIVAAAGIGALFAIPAVRTRGVNLAVITLGLAAVVGAMLFNDTDYTGGDLGTGVDAPSLFGFSLSAVDHPTRYALAVLAWFVLAAVLVANLRRGRVGRRLLAIRTNERAAAALGINVWHGKVYAFALSSSIAALGGILFSYQADSIIYSNFVGTQSITYVALAVIGGIGYLAGPVLGATLADGGLGGKIGDLIFANSFEAYLPLVAGLSLLILVIQNPDGIVAANIAAGRRLRRRFTKNRAAARPAEDRAVREEESRWESPRAEAAELELRDITVRYGGVTAVEGASFTVSTGRLTGLIGPNGAGKTTVIDVITGFTRPASGDLLLDGTSILRRTAAWRARAGISRSFQSLELFDDMTVRDNLRTASDRRDLAGYLTTLVRPGREPLTREARAVVREFGLEDELDRRAMDLSHGKRRMVAIARAVAARPALLLLDEPAAGLSEQEAAELGHLIRRLVDVWGIGVLLIEHDVRLVMSLCDDVVVLDFGRTIAHGTPAEVQNAPEVIAAYLGAETVVSA